MAQGDRCRVSGCGNFVTKIRGTLCEVHRYRWEKFKCFGDPPKVVHELPQGIIKNCIHHGYLTKDKVHTTYIVGRKLPQLRCKECTTLTQKNSKTKSYAEKKEENSIKRKSYYLKTLEKQHAMNRKRKFGITQEQYDFMLKSQEHVCSICRLPESVKRNGRVKKLSVDHCHKNSQNGVVKIRGLLCSRCNIAFGAFRESEEVLQNAILYAQKHNN